MNGIAMNAVGRGSPENVLPRPSANQCTPYAVNASAVMYSGLSVKDPNHVRPTNRMIPRDELQEARHPDAPDSCRDVDLPVALRIVRQLLGPVDQVARPQSKKPEGKGHERRCLEVDDGGKK